MVQVTAACLVPLLFVRCAPTDQCLRLSDCGKGLVCVEGKCEPTNPELPDSASSLADAAIVQDATRADTSAPVDAGTAKPSDAATATDAEPDAAETPPDDSSDF